MKELNLQYPYIPGNQLCDGTWHQISVTGVWRLANSPHTFIMEYLDRNYNVSCLTVLIRTTSGLQKAPLISYEGIHRMTDRLLIPVSAEFLPNLIYAFGVSYDFMDLSLRMMRGDSPAASGAGAPPPPPPPPPNGGDRDDGVRAGILIKVDANALPRRPILPPVDGQVMYVCRRNYQIATLFIYEQDIYTGRLTKDGLVITRPSIEELLPILQNYFIVWRDVYFDLIWDDVVVMQALDRLMDECARKRLDVEIFELEMADRRAWNVNDIPEWIARGARRYCVHAKHMD